MIAELICGSGKLERLVDSLGRGVAADDGRLIEYAELNVGHKAISGGSLVRARSAILGNRCSDEFGKHAVPSEREITAIVSTSAETHDASLRELIRKTA